MHEILKVRNGINRLCVSRKEGKRRPDIIEACVDATVQRLNEDTK